MNALTQLGELIVKELSQLGVWYVVLFNFFGVLAIIFKVLEAQMKSRKLIVAFAIVATSCWMIYYLLNGNLTSVSISLVAITKYLIFNQRDKHKWAKHPAWLIGFVVLQVVLCVITYKNWTSLLSTAAGIIGTFAYYTLSLKRYRYTLLACQLCWVANGLLNGYVLALAADTAVSISIIVAIIRFTIIERKEKNLSKEKST